MVAGGRGRARIVLWQRDGGQRGRENERGERERKSKTLSEMHFVPPSYGLAADGPAQTWRAHPLLETLGLNGGGKKLPDGFGCFYSRWCRTYNLSGERDDTADENGTQAGNGTVLVQRTKGGRRVGVKKRTAGTSHRNLFPGRQGLLSI